MSDRTFDPNAWLDAYRETFAPVYKAQQEGFKTIERFARFQYSVAGDYLESGLAHAQAAFAAKNPAELLTKQAEIEWLAEAHEHRSQLLERQESREIRK